MTDLLQIVHITADFHNIFRLNVLMYDFLHILSNHKNFQYILVVLRLRFVTLFVECVCILYLPDYKMRVKKNAQHF
jgi:hypothetical protein